MLTKDERKKLLILIHDYSVAEINVGMARGVGFLADEQKLREAVASASHHLQMLVNYVKEVS